MSEVVEEQVPQKQIPVIVNIHNGKEKIQKPAKPPKVLTHEQRFVKRFARLRRYFFAMRVFNFFFHSKLPNVVFIPDYVALTLEEMESMLADFHKEIEVWKQEQKP